MEESELHIYDNSSIFREVTDILNSRRSRYARQLVLSNNGISGCILVYIRNWVIVYR